MDETLLDELCLGAEAEVTGHPEVGDKNLCPPWKPQEAPNKSDGCTDGVVTMETRREEEPTRKNEEERWRKLYPEIKKCVIVIARLRLNGLNVLKLKQEGNEGRRAETRGERARSGDPQQRSHWVEPLDDSDGEVRFRSFVKKVVVQANHGLANGTRRPCGRPRKSGLLRLRQCQSPYVTADPAHRSRLSERALERWRQIRHNHKEIKKDISQSETDHNYNLSSKVPDTPETDGQSQNASRSSCCGHKDGDSCSTEKNPPNLVFRKVGGDQWVLRRSEVKNEEEEEKEKEEDSSINTEQMKLKRKEKSPQSQVKRRRSACQQCVACLRKDCGKCTHCLDKPRFGGLGRMKQRCRLRVCLVVTRSKARPPLLGTVEDKVETVTMATATTTHPQHQQKRRSDGKDDLEEEEKKKEEVKRCGWRRRWGRRTAEQESEDDSSTQLLMKEEEEEPKKEMQPHQFLQFVLVNGAGELLPEALLTGTHIQLNLTLDGSHFTPSILSDSTLATNSQSGQLPQEASVLHVSTGLTNISPPSPPPPSFHAPLLQPKEEEEAVEITSEGAEGGRTEETAGRPEEDELCSEGVTDRGRYYEVEVEVPDSDEETVTVPSTPPEVTGVTDDVTASDFACEPPEFISLSAGSFSLLGGGVSDEVTCGRALLRLLQALRRTVLPAHWVPVLAGGPLLQLLQCCKLSSMADTIVHVQPDRCFYITVQNRPLPDTHALYHTHTQKITHLSQLVSVLLELERLIVCRGSRVRSSTRRLEIQSSTCHLLVAPPGLTCLPCLLQDEEEEEDETEGEEDDEELSAPV